MENPVFGNLTTVSEDNSKWSEPIIVSGSSTIAIKKMTIGDFPFELSYEDNDEGKYGSEDY